MEFVKAGSGKYLDDHEIAAISPDGVPGPDDDRRQPLREALHRYGHFTGGQLAGRQFPVGCVALEITQRCNLDCTLCYLSDMAEAVQDPPLAELYRRIDRIHAHYGDNTNIQITGGDPTLRTAADLTAIVRYISGKRMRSALFTNGIRAIRPLLAALAESGLNDVVFHVDRTQQRRGYVTESDLNALREDYIARAKGLGLRILFNTTVFRGNFHEVPDIVRFFLSHANSVNLASFQLQADTGRGVLRERDAILITQDSVIGQVEKGVGCPLPFDLPMIGHPRCNRYAALLESGGAVTPLYDDMRLFTALFAAIAGRGADWNADRAVIRASVRACLRKPALLGLALRFLLRKLWALRGGLIRSRGRLNRLSFFVHNFMDEKKLERERCECCVFKVATADGPVSMCVHNARRDAFITKPSLIDTPTGPREWSPLLQGQCRPCELPEKRLKGRLRRGKTVKPQAAE